MALFSRAEKPSEDINSRIFLMNKNGLIFNIKIQLQTSEVQDNADIRNATEDITLFIHKTLDFLLGESCAAETHLHSLG
jgi:hypothetical protein